ncbi:MAG: L,D-transpeptidase family protein [Methylovulum sp.]|nr:L,D-transpeptidase family protein [Methylovulum sp.]
MQLDRVATGGNAVRLSNDTALFFLKINNVTHWVGRYAPRLFMLLCLALPAHVLRAEEAVYELSPVAQEINAIIATKQHPYLMPSNFANRAEDLDALYKMANYQLLWLGDGHAEKNITDVLGLLENATSNGLNKEHYATEMLQRKRQAALSLGMDAYKDLADYDTAISLSLLRFLHDLHYGRVNPQGINFNLKLREKKLIDLPVLVKSYLEQQSLQSLPALVEPKLQQYQKLKSALANYRELAGKATPFQLLFEKAIRPGDPLPQHEELRLMLTTFGDLPETQGATENSTHYAGSLVAGIKAFQHRHGLAADGVIGKSTAVELNIPLQQRVAQIELAMERLRWLPELSSDPSVIVNIPAFQLWAFENINAPGSNVTNMRVVVGKAMKNQTPVLMATMSFIDFSPYWNVPYNIVKEEIIPKLSQNPSYLDKENMELVSSAGVSAFSEASITQLKQGSLRVRQRPGKKNALGKVKFLFPNKNDVYLHDTPANALFSRSRRDFSHGCVRVSNPEGLAEFALKNQKGWDKATIQQAMHAPKMQRVILKKPIPVLFFYITAFFDQQNELIFYPDIYGHDTVLQEALKKPEDLSDQLLFASTPVSAVPVESIKTVNAIDKIVQ